MFNLSDKAFNTLSKIQKVLLAIMAIASIIMCFLTFLAARNFPDFDTKVNIYNFALTSLVFALAMICGFLYASKSYSKPAHNYYKAMMCFYAFATLIPIITTFRLSGFDPLTLIVIIKFILLLILGFGKDLGKKNTWIIFYIILVLELLYAPLMRATGVSPSANSGTSLGVPIPETLARLVITGILGLCIEAKYRDKDARGTV